MVSEDRKKEMFKALEESIYGELGLYSLSQRAIDLGFHAEEVAWIKEEDMQGRIDVTITVKEEA